MLQMYLGSQGRVPDPNRVPVKVIPFDSEEGDEEEDINTWKRVKTNPRWATKPRRPLQSPSRQWRSLFLSLFQKCPRTKSPIFFIFFWLDSLWASGYLYLWKLSSDMIYSREQA